MNIQSTIQVDIRDANADADEHAAISLPSDGIGSNISGDEMVSEKSNETEEVEDNNNPISQARLLPQTDEYLLDVGKAYDMNQTLEGVQTSKAQQAKRSESLRTVRYLMKKNGEIKNKDDDEDSDSDDEVNQDEQNFLEFYPEANNQQYNKAVFREKYGYEIGLPCYYILDSRVYPMLKQEYIFVILKYKIPDTKSFAIKEFIKDQEPVEKTWSESYDEKHMQQDFMCLKVLLKENGSFKVVRNIAIDEKNEDESSSSEQMIRTAQLQISPNGKHLAILIQNGKKAKCMLYSLDETNIEKSLEDISKNEDQKPMIFQGKFTMVFGWASQNVILYNNKFIQVLVINVEKREIKDLIDRSVPDHNRIEKIIDVKFGKKVGGRFQCLIAAKEKGKKNILIMDLLGQSESRNIVYFEKEPIVKISIKNDNAAASNGRENYLLEYDEHRKAYEQKQIDFSIADSGRQVRYIYPIEDDFLFVYHKEHDNRLRIESSSGKKFYFEKNIEPGRFIVYDIVQSNKSQNQDQNQIVILNSIHEEFHYNFFNYQKKDVFQEIDKDGSKSGVKGEIIYWKPLSAYCFTWPYVAYSDFKNTILLFNAFDDPDKKFFRRLFIPHIHGTGEISAIKITDNFQLYCLTQNTDDYTLWTANLDNFDQGTKNFSEQKILVKRLFSYKGSFVKNAIFYDIFIRSANLDKYMLLMVMIQHGDAIYFWKQDPQNQKELESISFKSQSITQGLASVSANNSVVQAGIKEKIQSRKLQKLHENSFIVRQDNKDGKFIICKIELLPNLYRKAELYVEKESIQVKEYFYDDENFMFFIFSESDEGNMRVKLYDYKKQTTVAIFQIAEQNIVDKILSQNYTVIGGFIYFNNQVIKIRYDQIKARRSEILKSSIAFDQYDKILDLKSGQEVTAYMTRNFENQRSYKVIILPYLHERKIYLNKQKDNQDYFYVTLTQDPFVDRVMNGLHQGKFEISEESIQEVFDVTDNLKNENLINERAREQMDHFKANLLQVVKSEEKQEGVVSPLETHEVLDTVRLENINNVNATKVNQANNQVQIDLQAEGGDSEIANMWAQTIKKVQMEQQATNLNRQNNRRKSVLSNSPVCVRGESNTNYIFSINQTKTEYHVYDHRGKLVKEVNYHEEAQKYGNPINTSSNGLLYIFQKPEEPHIFNIMGLTIENFLHFDTIDLKKELGDGTDKIDIDEYFKNADQINYESTINDRMDVMVQVSRAYQTEIVEQVQNTFQPGEQETIRKILAFAHKFFQTSLSKEQMWQTLKSETDHTNMLTQDSYNTLKFMSIKHWVNISKAMSINTGSIIYVERYNPHEDHHHILEHKDVDQYQYLRSSISFHKNEVKSKKDKEIIVIHSNQIQLKEKKYKNQKMGLQQFGDKDSLILHTEITREIYDFNNHFKNYKILQNQNNFAVNNRKIFFWNQYQIWYYDIGNLADGLSEIKMPKLNLYVDKVDQSTYIRKIYCGSNSNQIVIRVKQSSSLDYIMTWDMVDNREIDAFDVPFHAKVIQDRNGSFYLIYDGKVVICNQNVRIQSFEIQNNSSFRFEEKGFQFDHLNHNWILQNMRINDDVYEFIGLSFSFMTLVIRHESQLKPQRRIDVEHFDSDQFNFIMNHKNFMTCDRELLTTDFEQLDIILRNLKKKHTFLLEQLHYYFYEKDENLDDKIIDEVDKDIKTSLYTKGSGYFGHQLKQLRKKILKEREIQDDVAKGKKIAALHLAKSNNRSVGIILKYMAMIDSDCSKNFQDVLGQCVENPSFIQYIANLPFQTVGMVHKQTLVVDEQYNDQIVKVDQSSSSFTDASFFTKVFQERPKNPNFKSFPVRVIQLNISWLMTENGKNFLQTIESSENIGLYETQTMILIIEFLYKNFRNKKLKTEFPIFIIQTITYFIVCLAPNDSLSKRISNVINLIFSLYTLYVIFRSLITSPQAYLGSIHAYTEVLYCALILAVSFGTIANYTYFKDTLNWGEIFDLRHLRIIESFLSILILDRLFYYFQMVDAVSPLITTIYEIFKDIKWFVIIMVVTIFAFSVTFYLIGQNQIEYDLIESDAAQLQYGTIVGSLQYVYWIVFTQYATNFFDQGKASQNYILWFYFLLANFLFVIHFLNMLIAIMGATFQRIDEVRDKMTLRQHLTFILTNWSSDPIQDKHQVSYLIAAFLRENNDADSNDLNEMKSMVKDLKTTVDDKVLPRLFYQHIALRNLKNSLEK